MRKNKIINKTEIQHIEIYDEQIMIHLLNEKFSIKVNNIEKALRRATLFLNKNENFFLLSELQNFINFIE